jgi:hypothetical protein
MRNRFFVIKLNRIHLLNENCSNSPRHIFKSAKIISFRCIFNQFNSIIFYFSFILISAQTNWTKRKWKQFQMKTIANVKIKPVNQISEILIVQKAEFSKKTFLVNRSNDFGVGPALSAFSHHFLTFSSVTKTIKRHSIFPSCFPSNNRKFHV